MPCDTQLSAEQTAEQRRVEIDEALQELEASLDANRVRVEIGADGAVCFVGWGDERSKVTDVCAYLTLSSRDSWALRQAVASAETMSGRQVNVQAVSGGSHSHDGGATWSSH